MERKELREDLERLHRELSRSPSVDDESRQLLVELARDIEAVLERRSEAGEEHASLVERLRAATGHFEESYPDLTTLIGRIADMLARLGI